MSAEIYQLPTSSRPEGSVMINEGTQLYWYTSGEKLSIGLNGGSKGWNIWRDKIHLSTGESFGDYEAKFEEDILEPARREREMKGNSIMIPWMRIVDEVKWYVHWLAFLDGYPGPWGMHAARVMLWLYMLAEIARVGGAR